MKYSIEVKKDIVTEQFEYKGKEFRKEWKMQYGGMCLKTKEFHEQLEDSGVTDEKVLEEVYSVLDSVFVARFLGAYKMMEGR